MRQDFDGYKASTMSLNSPEVMKHAYGPQMNAHIDAIKRQHKSKSDSFKNDIGQEFADHLSHRSRSPVTMTLRRQVRTRDIELMTYKPKFCFICCQEVFTYNIIDGRIYGECHKSDAKQPMVEQLAQRARQTKGEKVCKVTVVKAVQSKRKNKHQ